MNKFNVGDIVYIIESSRFITKVEIMKYSNGFYLIKYPNKTAGYKVRESRLYKTEIEAKDAMRNKKYN